MVRVKSVRIAAAAIALVAWAGLAIQFAATNGRLGDPLASLWTMLAYFTVLSNLAVALFFSHIARRGVGPSQARPLAALALTMLLVGITYWLLLRGLRVLSGGDGVANLILHGVTPVVVPLFWLSAAPKGLLRPRDAFAFAAAPAGYFVYALARGALTGRYAYPFLDVTAIGGPGVAANFAVMGAAFLLGARGLVALDRRLAR